MKIKIALAITETGDWSAVGSSSFDAGEAMSYAADPLDSQAHEFFVECEVEIPKPIIVQGTVTPRKDKA